MSRGTFSDYAEDHLPPGQEAIETEGVKRLRSFMKLVMESKKRGYPSMGVITGRAGIGKSVAIQAFVDKFDPLSHTGLPPILKIKLISSSTPRSLARNILLGLQEKPRGRNRYELADEAAAGLIRNDNDLLIVDEADRLNEASFDMLRHIHDKTGCPVVLVGLPDILKVILHQEKFASRVGIEMKFPTCTKHELLTVVLPGLVFPRWVYDPTNEDHLSMGEEIFKKVGPSLRRLRQLLDISSQLAELRQAQQITLSIIEEAYGWTPFRRKKAENNDEQTEESEIGEYERKSARRKRGKRK